MPRRILAALLLFAFQTSPALDHLRQWLAAYDNPSWDVYAEFLKTNFAPGAENVFQDRYLRRHTGRFDLVRVEEETPNRVTVLLRGRESDKIGRLVLEVEASAPHRIVKLQARAIPEPPDLAPTHLTESEWIIAIRKHIDDVVAADQFSGAVLIAKDGRTIFAQAYGLADRARNLPNSLQTRFRIGSMNKMFTAVAILQLVNAGNLRLDNPIGKYLPDYPNHELASKVTISQLLNHTGGTGDFWGPEFDEHRLELKTHEDYIALFGARPLKFEPGTQFEYSNYGFLILGALIDKVSGQNYYDYVRDHVYRPARMTATGSEPEDQNVANRGIGYTRASSDFWRPNTGFLPYRGTSAGGGYTTVADLLNFSNALGHQKLLSAHDTAFLTTGHGFSNRTLNGSICFGHNGGSPGMNGDLEICQNSKYVVTVLANMDPAAAGQIAEFIIKRMPVQPHL